MSVSLKREKARRDDDDSAANDSSLTHLDHIVIAVEDLQAATQEYAQLLGRTPTWQGTHPGHGTGNSIFRLDNAYIELLSPIDEGAFADHVRRQLADFGEGLMALAFTCTDVDAVRTRLVAAGHDVAEPVDAMAHDEPSGAYRRFRNLLLPRALSAGIGILIVEHRSPDAMLPPSPAIGDDAGCAYAIDHVVVMTDGPERAIDFYGEVLGLRLALDKTFEKRGVRLVFFRVGGATIEIAARIDRPAEADAGDDRFFGAAYRVRDADIAAARLASQGSKATDVRSGNKPGTRVLTAQSGTRGVPTLFIQPTPEDP